MFKFLFGNKATAPEVKRETQRETVLRAQAEINEILARSAPSRASPSTRRKAALPSTCPNRCRMRQKRCPRQRYPPMPRPLTAKAKTTKA